MARKRAPRSSRRVRPSVESAHQARLTENHEPREPQREILPIPDSPEAGHVTYDARDPDTRFLPIVEIRPPRQAPNIVIILLDDVGFGASSAFGGPCQTPNIDRLAKGGLRYTRFHTTALCSPTRQAMLTGRNHHSVAMGSITELATSAPGYSSLLPKSTAPLPKILKLNGYSTAQFGKCHEVPVWHTSPVGPFDQWPTGGGGFEYFYGFLGGETNQYAPALYEGTTPIEPPEDPAYHFTPDMTDKAISWVRQQKALVPDKQFFMYFAPGATHAPHHVPAEWADRYRGKFDDGWDKLRERTLALQKEMGIIPHAADLTRRHPEIPAWDEMPVELRPVLARQMEIYAGFLEHTDHHLGRLLSALETLQVLDDTLIYVILGDNGASGEGTLKGSFNEILMFNGLDTLETPQFLQERLQQLGGPQSYNHYAVGWAHAMNTPYQWTKQVASHWGGTRNGAVVHWPRGISAQGELRHQFSHVIDVAPSILEAAGLPEPTVVDGVSQKPMEGTSMLYSFQDGRAPERHDVQYFEMIGNRGIYYKGWSAVTRHRTPWQVGQVQTLPFDDDVWELYDGSKDWTQAHDLSQTMPEKLRELQRVFLIEAARYNVLPLDDRMAERANSELAGRPELTRGDTQLLFGGMGRLTENSVINIKNKSFSITAEVELSQEGAQGVIIAQGGAFGGWSLYAKDGGVRFAYNLCGLETYLVTAEVPIPSGRHQVRMDFSYDGTGLGRGGQVTLLYDGKRVGAGRVERTIPFVFSADETTDVGEETGTPVTTDYTRATSHFTGKIHWVKLDTGHEDTRRLVLPSDLFKILMSRQ